MGRVCAKSTAIRSYRWFQRTVIQPQSSCRRRVFEWWYSYSHGGRHHKSLCCLISVEPIHLRDWEVHITNVSLMYPSPTKFSYWWSGLGIYVKKNERDSWGIRSLLRRSTNRNATHNWCRRKRSWPSSFGIWIHSRRYRPPQRGARVPIARGIPRQLYGGTGRPLSRSFSLGAISRPARTIQEPSQL